MTTRLEAIRKHLGLTQAQMAERLGLSSRALQDIEAGNSKERAGQILAAERVSLEMAVQNRDPNLATQDMRDLALKLAHLIEPPAAEADAVVPRNLADALIDVLSRGRASA